ncbi:hypothetical protein LO762_01940 [Actinocorallia sp. API 0066]|uniref:hypothetical protein n=1 Tax=Actinocorallia sp. API 0066 TaxID=2896846 RepID=UPI001E653EE7|nr:hypothetical protein [Actinocorallia sp. API 0066]MCD0447961.1 hypothetical protein [Actinocorallia sp. API 0066]
MPVPPVVRYRGAGGIAYLLAWGRRPDGSWWALLVWLETSPDGCRGSRAWVDAADVERLPGEDYRRVPRRPLPDHPRDRARDRTDPRDPGRVGRAADRARRTARRPDPDF